METRNWGWGERDGSRVNCFAEAVIFKPGNQDSATRVASPPGYMPRLDAKPGDSFLEADYAPRTSFFASYNPVSELSPIMRRSYLLLFVAILIIYMRLDCDDCERCPFQFKRVIDLASTRCSPCSACSSLLP
jgi:hypothetical protein